MKSYELQLLYHMGCVISASHLTEAEILKRWISVFMVAGIFISGFAAGCATEQKGLPAVASANAESAVPALPDSICMPHTIPAEGTIEVAFSPNGGAAETVIRTLDEAQKNIRVQAYLLTNADITHALIRAEKRGVDVKVILDKNQETDKDTTAKELIRNHIQVKVDHAFHIAHNKIMITDNINVVTGSFNFTKAAQQKNAENVIVVRGNQAFADLYIRNWEWRWADTQKFHAVQ